MKRKFIVIYSIALLILLCSCSDNVTDKFDIPVTNLKFDWGMDEESFFDALGDDVHYEEDEEDNGKATRKTITIKQMIETEYGTSYKTKFTFDNTAGMFQDDPQKSIGLFQIAFVLEDINRAELEEKLVAAFGEMHNSVDDWQTEKGSEIPLAFYFVPNTKITDMSSSLQEKTKKFILYNLENIPADTAGIGANLSVAEKADRVIESADIFSIIVTGDKKDKDSGLALRAYYLAVLNNLD